MTRIKIRILKSAFIRVTASWALCPYRRPELVGFVPDDRASAALPAFAVAAPVAVPPVAVVVVRAELAVVAPVADALADPAHVASAVAAADVPHAVLVDSEPVRIHDASVVVAAAAVAEQLRVVAAVAVVRVLRPVRLAAVVVAQVELRVQLAPHHDRLGAAPALCAAVRVGHVQYHAGIEQAGPAAEQPVVASFVLAEHHVRDAHLSLGTSVPSRAQVQY
jgi:hypothetical protein